MNKSMVRLAIALPILLGALLLVLKFTSESPSSKDPPKAAQKEVSKPLLPKRATQTKSQGSPQSAPQQALRDDDPVGDIRLEGQVLDEDDGPVGGALVVLGSAPQKTTTSEADGSFAFDNLVGRRYPVHARSENLVGGPVMVTLSETSDPVVVRMRPGAGLTVEVVDAENAPISGAEVTIPSLESIRVTTDEKGVAVISNIPPGQTIVAATAEGFAKRHSLAMVPRAADEVVRQRIILVRGTMLAGIIVDTDGKPVAGAHVIARTASSFVRLQRPKSDGVETDAKGSFQLVVQQGGIQLVAVHDDHPPTTSARIVVGDTPISDVEVTLEPGAKVSGIVVSAGGQPVPYPTVRMLEQSPGRGGSQRQAVGGKDGTFEMTGLPRAKLLAHASNQEASSQATDIDMRSASTKAGVTITLNIDGSISGVVVDENDEPVAEAQVVASPDFWDGADIEKLRARGPGFATSNGDGAFTIRGLPDTKFTLKASRGSQGGGGMGAGVAATTGDLNVRLVLATAATIEGEVQMSDGSTPAVATVSIGWRAGVPATDGKFTLSDVPPGTYELSVRGPDFETAYIPDIKVVAGARLDLGSVTVEAGRILRGTVKGPGGNTVEGAEVVLASRVISDGSNLTPKGLGNGFDERQGIRRAITDSSGAFEIHGLGKTKTSMVADHAEHGRSLGISVPAGTEDLTMEIDLKAVGSVRGVVRVNKKPVAGAQILINATNGESHIVIANSDDRGAFYAERVVVGESKVSAMLNASGSGSMVATIVTVASEAEVEANLDLTEGIITLNVTVEGRLGNEPAHIDASQVFLFEGEVDVKTGGDLNALFLKAASGSQMTFARGAEKAKFEKVVPGAYSVCVIPINGDMKDPAFAQKLQRNVATIAVYCAAATVAESPQEQAHLAIVPPMLPLPDAD